MGRVVPSSLTHKVLFSAPSAFPAEEGGEAGERYRVAAKFGGGCQAVQPMPGERLPHECSPETPTGVLGKQVIANMFLSLLFTSWTRLFANAGPD